jgi:hypothetical protein
MSKAKPEYVNIELVGFRITRILTDDYAQKLTCIGICPLHYDPNPMKCMFSAFFMHFQGPL